MDGKFLTGDSVRRLEKMPNKLQLLTAVAVMIKKVLRQFPAAPSPANLFACSPLGTGHVCMQRLHCSAGRAAAGRDAVDFPGWLVAVHTQSSHALRT